MFRAALISCVLVVALAQDVPKVDIVQNVTTPQMPMQNVEVDQAKVQKCHEFFKDLIQKKQSAAPSTAALDVAQKIVVDHCLEILRNKLEKKAEDKAQVAPTQIRTKRALLPTTSEDVIDKLEDLNKCKDFFQEWTEKKDMVKEKLGQAGVSMTQERLLGSGKIAEAIADRKPLDQEKIELIQKCIRILDFLKTRKNA